MPPLSLLWRADYWLWYMRNLSISLGERCAPNSVLPQGPPRLRQTGSGNCKEGNDAAGQRRW